MFCGESRGGLGGQASLEQLAVLSLALLFVSVAFYLASAYSSDSVKISQAEDAVGRLAAAVDYVYSLGPNSREYVTVYLPQDIEFINVSGKGIHLRLRLTSGMTDVAATTKADLIGALPQYRGKQKILVAYLANGKVSIGEAGIACAPQLITRSFNAGQNGSDEIRVGNSAEKEVRGISASLSGSAGAFTSISQPSPNSLLPGENATIAISYSVPENQGSGVYGGIVSVDSENDGACITQLAIYVAGKATCPALCASQGYASGTCRQSPAACINSGEDHAADFDYACQQPSPSCCCGPTQDVLGPLVSFIGSTPSNASAAVPITINATCDDSSTGGSYIKSAQVQIDGGAWSQMLADDGAFSSNVVERVSRNVGSLFAGQHIAGVRCTDTANNTGPISYLYFNVTMADVLGPIITAMNHTEYPTTLTNLSESGVATDVYTGGANIQYCEVKVDSGNWVRASPLDGAYDSPTEEFFYNVGLLPAGLHNIYARCVDALGNVGGIYNDTFGVVSIDVVLVMDRSGSMAEPVTFEYDTSTVSTSSASFTLLKTLPVSVTNGNLANVSVQIRAGSSGCNASFEARIGSNVVASGSTTSTSYVPIARNFSIAGYSVPFNVDLYMRRASGSCTVYNNNFNFTQLPTKMYAAQVAADTFVDIVDNSTKAALVSYSTSATLVQQLTALDSPTAKNNLKNNINALTPSGNTCIGCGINTGVSELVSARSRYPNATRVEILLTDGQNNVEPPTTTEAAANARNSNVIVYTIGFGSDVDATELTNIALLTHGKYYYAPDAATLLYIYQHIGQ
ncbi:MAG: VWA domain-containing protein [Candidatus Micrarchaeota archaeon]|nr:VWA domain-containing protein [Candidatus Micrarchaeota archaeon]